MEKTMSDTTASPRDDPLFCGNIKIAIFSGQVVFQQMACFDFFTQNFTIRHFFDKAKLFRFLNNHSVDLILLDADWIAEAHDAIYTWRLCQSRNNVSIIVLSLLKDKDSMFNAVENGADDIIVWPFTEGEIIARVRRNLLKRKTKVFDKNRITQSPFLLDKEASRFFFLGEDVMLTGIEFKLAWALFLNFGALVMREQIADYVWNKDFVIVQKTLDQHIYKLRKKLSRVCEGQIKLITVYGLGYKIIRV